MAGAKKKKVDDAPQSKTARASMKKGKAKDEGFKASGELDRVVPLAGGEFAYIRDPRNGFLHHLRVGSPSWTILIQGLLEGEHGERIAGELRDKNLQGL